MDKSHLTYDDLLMSLTDAVVGDPVEPDARYLNRELSWLDFNARVLALAEDSALPVLERAKFLAIFSQNLDEFFQVRVSALKDQIDSGLRLTSPDGLDQLDQLQLIRARVDELVNRQAAVFTKEIGPALDQAGIRFVCWDDLDGDDRKHLDGVFEELIFPVLTPLAVDPAHPFPYISNLSLNLAITVRDPALGEDRFARVKVPPLLPRFIALPDGERFVPLEQVIAAHLDALFPGMSVLGHHVFRVTRDTDFELSDESEDLLSAIEVVLQQRTKFGRSVRLEIDTSMTSEVLDLLCRELELEPTEVSVIDAPLDLAGLWSLYELHRDDLKYPPWRGVVPPGLEGDDIFADIRAGDVLVHLPYESFAASVEAFVAAAARDPRVLAIKQTLYRAGGDEAGIVASLAKAAREGKQVVTLVELKARFDEQANIERARSLEQAGVHVVYGLVGLKTHCKVLLVVRQEADGIRRYCHVGTGNYNPKTATLYEDLGVFSADPALGADLSELFNYLTGYGRPRALRRLIVAPSSLRPELTRRIAEQGRPGGRIVMKMNALVDPELIDAFYDANGKGAEIDLLIRGICCLRPGVPGLSEHIRVRSIVGRFLEHSRIFRFGPREGPAEYLIGSADLMPRNLDRRIEALLTVTGPTLQARLDEILEVGLADDVGAWDLSADGTWHKVHTGTGVELQRRLQELALARAQARIGTDDEHHLNHSNDR